LEFQGTCAIVTGGSKGIGKAVATKLHDQGASLVLVGRGIEALEQTAHLLGGNIAIVVGDVADASTAQRAVDLAMLEFGGLQLLANIAGVFPTGLLQDITDTGYADTIAANLTGTFMMCRAALPVLRAGGGGSIVNMSSTAARFPTPGLSVYGASKAGIEAFTRAIAVEAAPIIRVNAVSAGPTWTETVADLMGADMTGAVAAVTQSIPLGRLGTVDEIAEAVIFLLSKRASFITGQVLQANGGGIMA
jgi:NAD(P)-dependent dehydrogenase (short-subunit alcohol dehydrogenase family)